MSPKVMGVDMPDRYDLLEKRVAELERRMGEAREKLDTLEDLEEEISQNGRIPSDAPKVAKAGIAGLRLIPPQHRWIVVVVLGLAIIGGLVFLLLRGVLKL